MLIAIYKAYEYDFRQVKKIKGDIKWYCKFNFEFVEINKLYR